MCTEYLTPDVGCDRARKVCTTYQQRVAYSQLHDDLPSSCGPIPSLRHAVSKAFREITWQNSNAVSIPDGGRIGLGGSTTGICRRTHASKCGGWSPAGAASKLHRHYLEEGRKGEKEKTRSRALMMETIICLLLLSKSFSCFSNLWPP